MWRPSWLWLHGCVDGTLLVRSWRNTLTIDQAQREVRTIFRGGGVLVGLYLSEAFSVGGWFTAAVLFVFAFVGRAIVLQEERRLQHPSRNGLHLEEAAGV